MKNFIVFVICSMILNYAGYSQFKNIGGSGKALVTNVKATGNDIYASSHAGIHKSDNGGVTWTTVPGSRLPGSIVAFQINEEIIVAVTIDKLQESGKMCIHTSINGGLSWVKKDVERPYYLYGYGNEITIHIKQNIICVATFDELLVSVNFGVDFRFITDKYLNHFRSDYVYYSDGYHYLIENNKVTKTDDFVTFTNVYLTSTGSISGFFSNKNTLYIYNNGALKLESDTFKEIDLDESLFDNTITYGYDDDYMYFYEKDFDIIWGYDYDFKLKNQYAYSDFFMETSDYNNVLINDGVAYYYNDMKFGMYKKFLDNGNNNKKEIAVNIKGAKGNYIMADNRLWQIDFGLSYYNIISKQWQATLINHERIDYAIVSTNEIFITNPASVVNPGGLKIRNSSIPDDYLQVINCNDLVLTRDVKKAKIYTLIDGILPWIEINQKIYGQDLKTEYSNGYYILHNEKDEIVFSQNKCNCDKIKINPLNISNSKIKSVQISPDGNIYLVAEKFMYQYSLNTQIFTKIIPSVHPYQNEEISDFAMHKEIMVQSFYGKGIITSNDLGKTWQSFNEGLPDPFILDILFNDTHLYVSNQFEIFERHLTDLPGLSKTENNLTLSAPFIKVYPNPASGVLYYSLSENVDIHSVEIYNGYGNVAFTEKISSKSNGEICIKDLNAGVYLLKFRTETGIIISKFVKL